MLAKLFNTEHKANQRWEQRRVKSKKTKSRWDEGKKNPQKFTINAPTCNSRGIDQQSLHRGNIHTDMWGDTDKERQVSRGNMVTLIKAGQTVSLEGNEQRQEVKQNMAREETFQNKIGNSRIDTR